MTAGSTSTGGSPRFALLGPLEVRDDLGRAVPVSAPKQRGVLATLLVDAGTVVSADRLSDLLWDSSPPPSATKTLENYVSRLRRLLGPVLGGRIITRSPGYVIEPRNRFEVDLVIQADLAGRAQEAAARGDWARAACDARDALALWRGDPFCDIPVERLRREQAPHLAEARLRLRELALTAQVMLGDHQGALPELRRLVEETRIREHPWEMLILALFRCGRKAEAFEAYRRVRWVLRDELGVDPGRGLQQLQRHMLSDDELLFPSPATGTGGSTATGGSGQPATATMMTTSAALATNPALATATAMANGTGLTTVAAAAAGEFRPRPSGPPSPPSPPPAAVHQALARRYESLPSPQTGADPDPARALRLLSGWSGADLPLAAVCAVLRRPPALVRRDLAVLIDQELAESPTPDRFRLPAMVRLFGRARAGAPTGTGGPGRDDDAAPGAVLRRLGGWYLRSTVEAGNVLHPYGRRPGLHPASDEHPPETFGSYRQASVWVATEHENLMTTVRMAATAGEHALAWRLAAALTGYFHVSKRWTDWITTAEIGLASARQAQDRFGESALLVSAGLAYDDLRMYGRSLEMLERALSVGKDSADQWGEAVSLLSLAHVRGAKRTMADHQSAQKIFSEVGNSWGFALTQIELGRAHRNLGDLDQAIACHRHGAAILGDLGDEWGLGLAHIGLAEDHLARGDHASAALVCRRTLALTHGIRDRHTSARALTLLGHSYLKIPDPAAARRSWTEALRIFEDLADPRATQLRVGIATLDAAATIAS
ncbi:AfsR/SARP family transcriptional regulator [Parafrankia elaeagni]|uniref:AfsR/SARP family transcriptional regulator n=1 Tax=Parafrankia elaeagni TaxID=222534 RepID=UPI000375C2E1|nr:AfsR/SARP family transcriptional regulator [Parafrankia elaeagni]